VRWRTDVGTAPLQSERRFATRHVVTEVADHLSRLRGPGRDRKAMRTDGVAVD
jgi:hypothetical protein